MKLLLPLLLVALAAPAPALAEDAPKAPTDAVREVTVFGNDACPPTTASEIVVCARRPESDRYRIPKALRGKKRSDADGAWTNTVAMLDDVSRTQSTPDSCSPNGANGQTGCTMKMLHSWYADRKRQKADSAEVDADAQAIGDAAAPDANSAPVGEAETPPQR